MRSVTLPIARGAAIAAFVSLTFPPHAIAQGPYRGIAIGDVPDVIGLRINFRDNNLRRVDGVNITLWSPYEPAGGRVRGVALGLPVTGARDITGLATGVFGVGASGDMRGIMVAPVGFGAGNSVRGLGIGGVGLGAGGDVEGIVVGGVGVGAGGSVRGLAVGGVGVGAGGGGRGFVAGGVGAGLGDDFAGTLIGGVGAGVGGRFEGFGLGGVGVGVGGDATGILIGGIGAGVGGRMKGFALGGLGVGAAELEGVFVGGLGVGAVRAHALVVTPGVLRIERDGRFEGLSINALGSMIKGSQHGVVIGLVNYARAVRGLQVGLINIIAEGGSHRVLPIVNWQD